MIPLNTKRKGLKMVKFHITNEHLGSCLPVTDYYWHCVSCSLSASSSPPPAPCRGCSWLSAPRWSPPRRCSSGRWPPWPCPASGCAAAPWCGPHCELSDVARCQHKSRLEIVRVRYNKRYNVDSCDIIPYGAKKDNDHYQVASDFIIVWWHPGDEETIGADSAEDLQIVWWQQSQIDFFRDRGAGVFLWVLEPLYLCHKWSIILKREIITYDRNN